MKFWNSEYSKSVYFNSHERYYSAPFHVCTGYRRKRSINMLHVVLGAATDYRPSCQGDKNGKPLMADRLSLTLTRRSRTSTFARSEYSKSVYIKSHERYYSSSFHVSAGCREGRLAGLRDADRLVTLRSNIRAEDLRKKKEKKRVWEK